MRCFQTKPGIATVASKEDKAVDEVARLQPQMPHIVLLTGVAGAGKTTIGNEVSRRLRWCFLDADDFQTANNVRQLAAGTRLSIEDRRSWIGRVREAMIATLKSGKPSIVAFPGLRQSDRAQLTDGLSHILIVHLNAPLDILAFRVKHRKHRFFNEALLQSEFDALEPPQDAIVIDACLPPGQIVRFIVSSLTSTKSDATLTSLKHVAG